MGVVSNGAEADSFYGGDRTVAYTYDKAGNRTKAWAETFIYDTRNRLSTDGTGSYTWNPVGSLGTYAQPGSPTETYTFDAGGRMTLVTDGAVSSAFGYDGLDRVTARNSTAFTYAGADTEPVGVGAESFTWAAGQIDEAWVCSSDLAPLGAVVLWAHRGQIRLTFPQAIVQNDFRAANIRAGYVYVISNPGTFGPGVVKIGLTRRLEPMDRVRELGGASVPFPFDVHAIFFSEDAVTLENELHKQFGDRRLNHVNQRREFFFVTPAEVESALAAKAGGLLEFVERPESTEFNRSRPLWPAFGR